MSVRLILRSMSLHPPFYKVNQTLFKNNIVIKQSYANNFTV